MKYCFVPLSLTDKYLNYLTSRTHSVLGHLKEQMAPPTLQKLAEARALHVRTPHQWRHRHGDDDWQNLGRWGHDGRSWESDVEEEENHQGYTRKHGDEETSQVTIKTGTLSWFFLISRFLTNLPVPQSFLERREVPTKGKKEVASIVSKPLVSCL